MKVGTYPENNSTNDRRPSADTVRFYYVYILNCKDDKPYAGCTHNLKKQIKRHSEGSVPAAKDRLPVKLISYFAFSHRHLAFSFEKYLKSGSGRAFLKKHNVLP